MVEKTDEKILNTKAEKWGGYDVRRNCTFDNELLVEITLYEYRELVEDKAQADYKYEEEHSKRHEVEIENMKLEEQNKKLRVKLFDMQDKIADLPLNEADESEENE